MIRPSTFTATLLAAVCGVSPLACTGTADPRPEQSDDFFIGAWEWQRSHDNLDSEQTISPQTEGFTMQLLIEPSGELEWARGDSVVVETTWEFVPPVNLTDDYISPKLRYGRPILGFEEHTVGGLFDGELVLMDPCCDGLVHIWIPRPSGGQP